MKMGIGTVNTKYGKIKGEEYSGEYSGITVFRGVPYAKPPVGELRWKPPADLDPWDDILVCDKFKYAAIQDFLEDRHRDEYYIYGAPEMSEDCLYLNICTGAAKPGEKRPVFMWYHGGGLTNCYAFEPEFDPRVLAKKGIIVVTVGQRLSIFGYLCLPQLSAEQGGKSGNYGLMDQIKALDWVYDNIEAFGGDPENITIGGQSGGCGKCGVMAASPKSKGRVKRIINQSGLKWQSKFPTLKYEEEKDQEYLRYCGIDPDISMDELRKLDTFKIFKRGCPRCMMPSSMVIDGEYIIEDTLPEAFANNIRGIDFLVGSNLGEADMFSECRGGLNKYPVKAYLKEIRDADDFYCHFRNLLGELYYKYDFENLVKVTDENAWFTANYLANMGLAGGEGTNISRNVTLARLFGGKYMKEYNDGKAFVYLWRHMLPGSPEVEGTLRDAKKVLAWHSTEMWYTFSSLRPGVPKSRPWTELDFKLADIMSSYWANFVKTGDPNGEGLPYWPAASDNCGYAELGDEIVGVDGIDEPLHQLFKEFVTREYHLDD